MNILKKIQEKEWSNELTVWIVSSLVLGFVLAIKVSWPKVSFEFLNFLYMFLLSLFIVFVFIASQKLVAWWLDCKTKTTLLSFRRFWFRTHDVMPFDFPAWLIFPLILVFATNNIIKWLSILSFEVEPKITRVRRRWAEITEGDMARIAIAGPASVLILGLITRIVGFNDFATLCVWFALIALVPIGYGFKLLMSSRLLWFFAFIFTLAIFLLMYVTSTFITIIIALLIAALLTLAYYILYEK